MISRYIASVAQSAYAKAVRPGRPHRAKSVEIIAHRGASHRAPENTLASVELAWQMGADAVEVDIHLSRDNRIVAIHDPSTRRTAGIDLEVATTSSYHLRRLDVGSHVDAAFADARIPFLEEILHTIPPGRRLFVEIKSGAEILPLLDKAITQSAKHAQVAVLGFESDTMTTAKKILPDVPVYWLRDTTLRVSHSVVLARKARRRGLDGLNVRSTGITGRFVSAVRRAGLKLYAWTVDDPAEAVRLTQLGVDGITTNRPGWLTSRIRMSSPAGGASNPIAEHAHSSAS
jgi:glycerophosphoryl diester phosphodiesterase